MSPTVPTIAELDKRFGIAGSAHVQADAGGHPVVRVATEKCLGAMYLHGAQVTSWKPAGNSEMIFLSSKAVFEEGKAIRGGVPVCFPWFRGKADDPKAPQHGFVRTKRWTLDAVENAAEGIRVTMSTASDDATRSLWPHDFRARLAATFGASLHLAFTVSNTGGGPLRYEEALHTYYRVSDISAARLTGLDGAAYLDNTDNNAEKKLSGDLTIGKATDSAFLGSEHSLDLLDAARKSRLRISKSNSRSTVVWNPWQEAAGKMADMGENEWRYMFCAEAANIRSDAVELAPGASHTISVTTSLVPW
jgi:glucose-6-phosphate 1-epimerase